MAGETNLDKLLATMAPKLQPEHYVFCCVGNQPLANYASAEPKASFIEEEGLTLVVTLQQAQQLNLEYNGVFRCISLQVHSSLEAVGLTAAISNQLAQHQISANVIAAFYHDHVFVPEQNAAQALALLKNISANV